MELDNATNLDRKSGVPDDDDLFPMLSQKDVTALISASLWQKRWWRCSAPSVVAKPQVQGRDMASSRKALVTASRGRG
jgi:hypothetical protein